MNDYAFGRRQKMDIVIFSDVWIFGPRKALTFWSYFNPFNYNQCFLYLQGSAIIVGYYYYVLVQKIVLLLLLDHVELIS